MNRFYVGQRVRVNASDAPTINGRDATVLAYMGRVGTPTGYIRNAYHVDADGFGSESKKRPGTPLLVDGANLIPLDDDSRTLTTWDAFVWKPGLGVGA